MLPDFDPPGDATPDAAAAPRPTLEQVYDSHGAMVWRTLRALGVEDARIDDAVQDVFLVVHRRLDTFEGHASIATWLYAIARRVASDYRRRGRRAPVDHVRGAPESQVDVVARREAARMVLEILEELDEEKREVFALIELEQLTGPVVAELLGIPLNTVYSRLRLARQRFDAALARRMPEGT